MSEIADREFMARAIALAERGAGAVEPNPMVGCVLVVDGQVVAEGWHERFGGPHAEARALQAAGRPARGCTAYVTLEPCAHHGKTPPCADALVAAGVRRVVVAQQDPFPQVAGRGLERLRSAGIDVTVGVLGAQASELNAPYLKRLRTGLPWVIAKWAMSLDGRIATASGESRWISGPESRAYVHRLRGRVDGILVGRQTALVDDPLLTARPPGPRVATRVVLDSEARLPLESQLVRTARSIPVLVVASTAAPADRRQALQDAGCEVLTLAGNDHAERLRELLAELGRRAWTNLLVEGGAEVLGCFFEQHCVDEVHAFVAPRIIGGRGAPGAIGGAGCSSLARAVGIEKLTARSVGQDIHLTGRLTRS